MSLPLQSYDAADAYRILNDTPTGEEAIATLARALVDKNNLVIWSSDDPTTLNIAILDAVTLTAATVTTSLVPTTNDGAALGDVTHNFSDLFLASGAVLNYANGNVALTHSSGILTLGTGELRITAVGTNAASVPTLGSTSTLTAKTLTAPVINGLTSASGNMDFSGSTGTFLTSTGVNTISGTATVAANKNLLCASGTGLFDFSLGTGIFKTSTGLVTIGGKMAQKTIATPVAATGSDAAGAAPLGSGNLLVISSDSAAKGVILPTLAAGDIIEIINSSATAAILYPFTGGTINGLSADAGVLIPVSKGVKLYVTAANTMTAYDNAAKATAA